MNALTDNFDIVIQVQEQTIERIFKVMHRAGVIHHRYDRPYSGKRVEVIINAPSLVLQTAAFQDQRARANMVARVYYHSRDFGNSSDLGASAVADVTIRSILEISTGDPAPLSASAEFLADWGETTVNDITVYGANPTFEGEVKDALLDFLQNSHHSYPIPSLTTNTGPIGSIAFRFLATGGSIRPVLAVGMNMGNVVKGTKTGLTQSFVIQDWAIALADNYVLDEIRKNLRAQFGSLPPPVGNAPVVVSDGTVCVLDTQWGCLKTARQQVILDRFDVSLAGGKIILSGQATQKTDIWYIPDITASFQAEATLTVGSDQSLLVSMSQPSVQLQQWYAQVFNFLSFNALQNAVTNGVKSALASSAQTGQISSLFSAEVLSAFASLGMGVNLQLTPSAMSVEIRPEAVIIHGILTTSQQSAPPESSLAVLNGISSPVNLIFHGGNSWTPGNQIAQFDFDFGDGTRDTTSGTASRFVVQHNYKPGSYYACLTITDSFGQAAKKCLSVQPGILAIKHLRKSGSEWEFCTEEASNVIMEVTSNFSPLQGVLVTVSGNGWQLTQYTNREGQVNFSLDTTQVRNAGMAVPKPSIYHLGAVKVTATRAGYQPQQNEYRLWMIDCAGILKAIIAGQKYREYVLDRLAGYAFLKELIKSGYLGRVRPPVNPLEPQDFSDPRVNIAAQIGFATDFLTRVIQLMEMNSGVLPVAELFGLDARRDDFPEALNSRMEQLWNHILDTADAAEHNMNDFGNGGRRRPEVF